MSLPTPRHPALLTCSLLGLGYLRPAPGSWGSLPPVCLAAVLLPILGPESPDRWHPLLAFAFNAVFLLLALAASLCCAALGDYAEAALGRKDAPDIVIDETAGQCLPLLFLPSAALATTPVALFTLALAFLAFRFFDITKPWPAHRLQALPGGVGILLDDLVAGCYAAAFLHLLTRAAL